MAAINNKTTVFDAGEVFGGRKSGRPVVGFMEPNPYVPDEDIRYVMPEWAGAIAFWFAHVKDPLFVFGPTGCGKTSAVKQLARRINYPVYETTGHNRMEFPELVGHHAVIDGNMRFEYGPLTQAMKYGGIFLLNEVDLLSPDAMAGMNSILDGSPLCIAENGGEIIKPHPVVPLRGHGQFERHGRRDGAVSGSPADECRRSGPVLYGQGRLHVGNHGDCDA